MKAKFKLIDDGFCPKLVEGAEFDGVFEIPIVKQRKNLKIPHRLCPFTKAKLEFGVDTYIMFYEYDTTFRKIFEDLEESLPVLNKFAGIITPDCSLYIDMPLATQIANTYLNRAIGHYLTKLNFDVIHNIRWGDERSYSDVCFEKPFAFQGVEKGSIVSVGNYGCFKTRL